jgi:hypothetical protein
MKNKKLSLNNNIIERKFWMQFDVPAFYYFEK